MHLDMGKGVQNEDDNLTIVFANGQPIKPQLIILGVNKPRSSLLLFKPDHRAKGADGPSPSLLGDLLRDGHELVGLELF